jgi:hypothetical protein
MIQLLLLLLLNLLCATIHGASPNVPIDTSTWKLLAPPNTGPSARQGQASIYCRALDQFIVWSGFSGEGEMDFRGDLWAWKFATKEWVQLDYSLLAIKPAARVWHSLVAMEDDDNPDTPTSCRAVLYGGSLRAAVHTSLIDLYDTWILQVSEDGHVNWTPMPFNSDLPHPGPRAEHGMVWRRGSVIMFGGSHIVPDSASLCYADIWELNVNSSSSLLYSGNSVTFNENMTWHQITPVPTSPVPKPRFSMSVALQSGNNPDEDRLIIFAGRSFTGSDQDWVMLSDFWVYTFGTRTWKQIPGLALSRSYHTAIVVNNDMFVFGGYTRVVTSTTSSIYVFNDVLVTTLTGPKGADAGNSGDPGCTASNGKTGLWCVATVSGSEPNVRYDHTASRRRDELITFGGRFEAMLGDLWSFNTTRSLNKLALATEDQLGSSDLQSTMYFMIAILTMMVICFFVFVVSLRRQRTHPIFVAAMQRLRPMGARPHVIAALPLRTFNRSNNPATNNNNNKPGEVGSSDAITDAEQGNQQASNNNGGEGQKNNDNLVLPADDLHDMCAICLNDYEEGTQVRVLPCTHFFHPACVDQWLQRTNACPMCKQAVDDNPYAPEPAGVAAAAAAGNTTIQQQQQQQPPPAQPQQSGAAPTNTTTTTAPDDGPNIVIITSGDTSPLPTRATGGTAGS